LLATAPHTSKPSRQSIVNAVSSLIQQLTDGNSAAFARHLKRNRSVIFGWQHGKSRIPINDLLDVCDHLGISLIDFVTGNTAGAINDRTIRSTTRNRIAGRKYNWEELKCQLELVIKQEEEVSFAKVADRVNSEGRTLRRHFPDLCRAISAQWNDHLKKGCRNRRQHLSVTIRNVAFKLAEEGIYPSRRKVVRRLEFTAHTKVLGEELRNIHSELGLTHLYTNLRKKE